MKAPWHLWVVGVLSLIWNAMGAFDYAMNQFKAVWYLQNYTPAQLAYFDGFPAWIVAAWAFGVWFAVLGSVLLLVRSRWAAPVFLISLLGAIVTPIQNYVLSDVTMADIVGPGAIWFALGIIVVAAALWLYAQALTVRGVLR